MPIYEYACSECGKVFEVFLGVKDKAPGVCIDCNSANIRKLISNCSFQLKGTGWYLTDYARKDSNNGNGSKKGQKETPKTEAAEKKPEKTDTSTAAPPPKESKSSEKAA